MNGPVILDRRRVLAGGGALIVSFSLADAFAQDQAAPAAASATNSARTCAAAFWIAVPLSCIEWLPEV